MSILIVDDTKSIRSLIEFFLQFRGYKPILHAESGEQALEMLGIDDPQAKGNGITLIFLDVVMPGMSGIETCKRIRQAAHLAAIPVIMITSDLTPQTIEAVFEAGANEVVPKPLNKTTLLDKTAAVLGN
ncbi:MAG: response regulator [Proteobacteria bacterium]|nr:response regulator [Pseudomonadota bacterium]